jgi:error-prone DNA polymerase
MFYDLVIEVAIVRPGPIQGDMVHPYLRRRQGLEAVSYPKDELKTVLGKTLGVPLFQEQAMKIAIVAAGFTPAEADKLRRAMATFKRVGTIGTFQRKMIDGMLRNGYARDFAERCFQQIEGFGEYGFPESHAASFALLVYASAWLKCRYPDAFAAALLNAQPMGFYAPSQIVRDAREHGVEVRPPDINFSDWDSTLEPGQVAAGHLHDLHKDMRGDVRTTHAIRLGLREIKGLKEDDARRIVAMRSCPGRSAARSDALQTRDRHDDHTFERSRISDAPLRAASRPGREAAPPLAALSASSPPPERGRSPAEAISEGGRVGVSSGIENQHDPLPDPPPTQVGLARLAHDNSQPGQARVAWGREQAAARGSYDSVRDLWLRTGLPPRVLERLADADAFSSLGLKRRDALWAAKALGRVGDRDDDLPLFASQAQPARGEREGSREPDVALPPMPIGEEVVNDYRFLRLSLRAHPSEFLRGDLAARGILRNEALRTTASGVRATVSGLVTCRQRPGSANGVIFMTIEDETAMANIIVWPKTFERLRPIVLGARYVSVRGKVQQESGVIHVVAEHIEDLTHLLAQLTEHGAEIDALARCDEVRRPVEELRQARANGGRESRLERLMREMPDLAADLDTTARGSAHAPSRKAG